MDGLLVKHVMDSMARIDVDGFCVDGVDTEAISTCFDEIWLNFSNLQTSIEQDLDHCTTLDIQTEMDLHQPQVGKYLLFKTQEPMVLKKEMNTTSAIW